MNINNFKIIAIRALDNCSSDYTKVLELNKLYYFYSDYSISVKENIETISRENKDNYPEELFNINGAKNDVVVNISAIVGKNGSGKSSVIELLFRAINNIAFNFRQEIDDENINKTITADLKIVEGVHVEFYYYTDKFYKIIVEDKKIEVFTFNDQGKINSNSIDKDFKLSDLFYTEAVNYSHYAFNSLDFGYYKELVFVDWLKELFHKNDSYQTPLVLNPMRTEGNFDINRENELVIQRLLANLLRPKLDDNINFRKIGENLEAYQLTFSLKKTKKQIFYYVKDSTGESKERIYDLSVFEVPERNNIVSKLMEKLVNVKNFNIGLFEEKRYKVTRSYIIYKLVSICLKYDEYKEFLLPNYDKFDVTKFDDFILKLKDDTSHITFKLKQTLNYLKHDYINFETNTKILFIEEISNSIQEVKSSEQSILELIPPPVFNVEILLKSNKKEEEELVKFSSLSSGEKQQIYMVSSLLYHLYNLDSVLGDKVKYQNINIVLEEIELYFHPELQRTFIKHFLDSISRIVLVNIKSINICFITHSPFILSDIPSNNIMFLKVVEGISIQEKSKKNTFGANIHNLLIDNFFFDSNIYIGEFAYSKINETIIWLNLMHEEKEKNEKSEKNSFELLLNDKKYYKNIIEIIDEPIIKSKLFEMYSEIFGNEERIIYLESEKSRIDGEIERLKKNN